jgi:hypothetical protein
VEWKKKGVRNGKGEEEIQHLYLPDGESVFGKVNFCGGLFNFCPVYRKLIAL